ncbi:legumain-like [Acipenser oxyrinchus oxyrinchus]|uniref:legumain n=1 Tax=Acipenser oxyrinchus oxyrinchus TaxID=40147 RepID=A0AAD8CYU7_ACIOX|nr:legumain-like [Acipenser oxyrinchus oxyrinchus]
MAQSSSKQWILLAAGSKGWDNYRHQADVCHAYHIARKNGIPDEQIVVMMYDDIAYHEDNPCKGVVINVPRGENVYQGVPKNYTGDDVSADNFLAVLCGDESAITKRGTKKVIESGCNDTIFIYLSDHGSQGIFSFPKTHLYSPDLINTIGEMSRNKRFSKMAIFVESCHSGSMLNSLPESINVYGVCASLPSQLSYACFYDEKRNTFLSDVFSTLWMAHTEKYDLENVTLQDQFVYIEKNMKMQMQKHGHQCTPKQYGNKDLSSMTISEFLGKSVSRSSAESLSGKNSALTHITPSFNVSLILQENRIHATKDQKKKAHLQKQYEELLERREHVKKTVAHIVRSISESLVERSLNERYSPTRVCELKVVSEHFRTCCYDWHDAKYEHVLEHFHVFVNLCELGVPVERIKGAITRVSKNLPRN